MEAPAPLLFVEVASLAILSFFLLVMARRGLAAGAPPGERRAMRDVLADVGLIGAAAWVGEVSCIRLYGFYQYDAPWTLFAADMPALVALIWPFVILSARELVHALGGGRRGLGTAALVGALVVYDASLVEPVAVRARLWSWNEPGLFGVPVIGILGWGYFAFAATGVLERARGWARLSVLVVAPLVTHALLLATWWGALRWVGRGPIPEGAAALGALGVAVVLTVVVHRRGLGAGLEVMGPRMAAAALFFALLATRGRDLPPLLAYGVTFAGPYLRATRFRGGG